MEMIIVEVSVPSISTKFDFKIPAGNKVSDVVGEIVNALEVTQNNVKFENDVILCDMDNGKVLSPEKYIAEHGIKDGSHLMLI